MKKLLWALLALVLLAAGAGLWIWSEARAFLATGCGEGERLVRLPRGAGPRAVARELEAAGVVCDARRFYWLVRWRKAAPAIKAGEYEFVGPVRPGEVLDKLVRGLVKTYKFTVPEGLRIDEIAPIVARSGLASADEFLRTARDASLARTLVAQDSLEGYLFPSTYTFPRSAGAEAIVRAMAAQAKTAIERAELRRAPGVSLGRHQIATLASIIEKETSQPDERPRISCVFHNRLKKGMQLATDPTVIYSVILRNGSFDGNLRKADLEADHPYNTYKVKGLPPGPIANAGEAAMVAALAPADCDDLFFVSRNDGTHEFCPDVRCHEAAVQKWQVQYFRDKRRR